MLQQWNVEFAKDLTSIEGRILGAEKIFQKDGPVCTKCECIAFISLSSNS